MDYLVRKVIHLVASLWRPIARKITLFRQRALAFEVRIKLFSF